MNSLRFFHRTWYNNSFTQVRVFYHKVLDEVARGRLAENIATSLVNASEPVQERTLKNFHDVDEDYARRVKEKMDNMLKTKHSIFNFKKETTAPLNPPRKAFTPVAS